MKCQHCGGNLNIEDNYCQNCGEPNPFAVKHQDEMNHYKNDYQKTKSYVLERSANLTKRNIKIAIIAVLVALIAVCSFILFNADNIRWMRTEKAIASEADIHTENIEKLMEDREYLMLYLYISRNNIMFSDMFLKYDAVYNTTQQYYAVFDNLITLQCKKNSKDKYTYINESETLEDIAKHISSFYKYMEPQEYNAEAYQGSNMDYMNDLKEHLEILVSGFFGITLEDTSKMESMTSSRIGILLEDNYNGQK